MRGANKAEQILLRYCWKLKNIVEVVLRMKEMIELYGCLVCYELKKV